MFLIYLIVLTASNPGEGVASTKEVAQAQKEMPYLLGHGDVLQVDVFGEEELSGTYHINEQGTMVFPLLGEVVAAHKTVTDLQRELTRLLADDYLFEPTLSITVKTFQSSAVSLLGDVARPGQYHLKEMTRLAELLSWAGGLNDRSGKLSVDRSARIIHASSDDEHAVREIQLRSLLVVGDPKSNVILKAGDVIYVTQPASIYVLGEVRAPGPYLYQQGMTVNRAISLAGGRTQSASQKRVWCHITQSGKLKKARIRAGVLLKPEQTIEVPLSFW